MKTNIKYLIFAAVIMLTFNSCQTNKIVLNREVNSEKEGKMLLGRQTRYQFLKEPFEEWYVKEYKEYQPDEKDISTLKKEKLSSYSIILVMGTWCSDSQREVPRLMKVLDKVKYPEARLEIICVNRKKEAPGGEEGGYNIQKVPTIILKKYGKEIGRIIEIPESGFIEKDLIKITEKDDNSLKNLFKEN
jgi:thiol-disulfide isomerase/thioredoxin